MARIPAETRHRQVGASTPSAPRPIVRDFSGAGSRADVTFEPRTCYDFMVSMNVAAGSDSDLLPEDAAWLKRAMEKLPSGIELDACFHGDAAAAFGALPGMAVARPDVADAGAFTTMLRDRGLESLTHQLLSDILRYSDAEALTDRIMDGDTEALAEAEGNFDESKTEIVTFLHGPRQAVERMLSVVEAWLPLYQEIEPRVAQMIHRDVANRRTDRETLDQATLIERTTGGLRWLPESQVRRVIMAPSYFARPFNYIYQGADWRLFAYPIADAVLGTADAGTPPQAVVRLYRALGDSTRMRILKLLSDRDWYLTELAQQLELSKPTMKHHLALLRAAGLVTVIEEGSLTYYNLRRERLEEAGTELHSFLG